MSIGKNIKRLRDALDLTQVVFAERLGVSRSSIIAYEREDTAPSADFFMVLIKTFDVNLNWLLLGEGTMFRTGEIEKDPESEEQRLRQIYPGLPDDPTIDDLVESLQVPIIAHSMLSVFILKRKEYKSFIDEYFEGEGETDEEKSTSQG